MNFSFVWKHSNIAEGTVMQYETHDANMAHRWGPKQLKSTSIPRALAPCLIAGESLPFVTL